MTGEHDTGRYDCPRCGGELRMGATVCPGCGWAVPAADPDEPAPSGVRDDLIRPADLAVRDADASGAPTWILVVVAFVVAGALAVAVALAAGGVVDGLRSRTWGEETDPEVEPPAMVVSVPETTGNRIEAGTCIDEAEFTKKLNGEDYVTTSCVEPHDLEVTLVFEFPGGPYPGEDAVIDETNERCEYVFWEYLGDEQADGDVWDELDNVTWWPTESGWESGYRKGTCMVAASDGTKLVGSVEWSAGKSTGLLPHGRTP